MNNAVFMYNNSKLYLANVISKVSVLPTTGISDGDKYWYSIDDNVYVYNAVNAAWTVEIPVDGTHFFLKSNGKNYEYYNGSWRIFKAGDSETVNGHTVNIDVPLDAKFTDTVYDDTAVKQDISNLQNDSHSHSNKTSLDKIGENVSGNLTYNGQPIQTEIPIATTQQLGVVKPDGTTTTIDADGTLHAVGGSGGTGGTTDYSVLSNKPKINGVELSGNKTLTELGIQPSGNYLTSIPSEYVTETELSNAGYALKTEIPDVSTKLENTNLKAGTNISLNVVGNDVTINSTATGGEGGGSVVADSATNGNIIVDGAEMNVYTLPSDIAKTSDIPNIVAGTNITVDVEGNNLTINSDGGGGTTEVSNPLTTSDVSQETPVGLMINYIGFETPEHFLSCDGTIYNISDYPFLAQHIYAEFGVYNIFGGDGITTFAVPTMNKLVEQLPYSMISNVAPLPYVATASSEYSVTYQAWKAFNGTNTIESDSWLSNTPAAWIQIDLGKFILLNSFAISSRNYASNSASYAPKDFTLQGSRDGENFTTLTTLTNQTNWGNAEEREYSINNPIGYRYFKLNITANNGGARTSIGEFKLNSTNLNNQYIKYEPTYYAVNQYGGFDKMQIYSGSASTVGAYKLISSISNFNNLDITISNSSSSISNFAVYTENIDISKIDYTKSNQFVYTRPTSFGLLEMYYHFSNATTLSIDSITITDTNIQSIQITSIDGIKGQLGSLIVGGTA